MDADLLEARYQRIRAFLEAEDLCALLVYSIILHSAFSLPGSGKLFVPLGDQLHVTGDGAEFLMNFSRDLFLIEL